MNIIPLVPNTDTLGKSTAQWGAIHALAFYQNGTALARADRKLDDFGTPDDNTDLDATADRHGLLSKLDKIKLDAINLSQITDGDMLKATYDPTNVAGDAFAMSNMQGTVSSSQVADGAITLGKMASLPGLRIIGNNSGVSGTPIALTTTQVRALINVADGANLYILPIATGTDIGGVKANTGSAGQFVTGIDPSDGSLLYDTPAGSGGVSDGDKGDITVSSSGAVWTIDNGAVTLAKMADMSTASLLGRSTAGTGSPEVLSASTARTVLGLGGAAVLNVGTTAGTVAAGDDSRLSDSRTPTSHTHGNITNAGAIGSTSGLPIKTGTSGVLEAGAFGTSAGQFAEGNHTHEGTAILSTGETGGTKFLRENGDGTCSWHTISGAGAALTANPLSQFAATTSSQLAGVISDETGSGALVFATSPTLVTPALGTPSSGTLTNCTGLPTAGLVDGAVTLAKMADLAEASIIGRAAGAGTGAPVALTPAEVRTLINVADGATAFNPASPGAIGGTTPAAATFSDLIVTGGDFKVDASGNITVNSYEGRGGSGVRIDYWALGNITVPGLSGIIDWGSPYASLRSPDIATLQQGANAASPTNQTFKAPDATSGNTKGGNLKIAGGTGSGTGVQGDVELEGDVVVLDPGSYIDCQGILVLEDYTVGTLPTASSVPFGEAVVTDANAPSVGATVASGGSADCKVMSNGTNWIVTALL